MPETKKYSVIYADPPWRYDMKRGNGVAENHYPTMSMEDICALPVAELAAKDSALFLWATRGHPKRQCAGIHQFVISHIEQHSKKPDEVREKIVKLMGDQPRLELFARQQTPGWDVWGNEVESSITMPGRKE